MSNKAALEAGENGSKGELKNGNTSESYVPELLHVTNNIIPLSNVLRFHTQDAYQQLSRVIEDLANTRTSESDISRKKKFLTLIVSLRQDFIKIYTLVKWAQRSKDVSKLIDLLNWLRTQEFYFDNLALGLNELNHFSGAKLPDSDILTALEVLAKGRPQLPSYNYIERPPVSAEKILEVLRDLNLTLTARMALIDDMPPRFLQNYVVRDGRIVITIANEFQVSITVANDLIIDKAEDYYKSPFFFIDFSFLFGINPDTLLITHQNSNVTTTLPKKSRERLETLVNQILLKSSLSGLYDVLHKYATSFKLYLISRQLRDLSINSKWRGNIQYKHSPFLVIINYWSNHYLSRNWKAFIEIGMDKNYTLNFRWFKNGKYELNHGISAIAGDSGDDGEAQDISVDFILSHVINKHSELLMARIHDTYKETVSNDTVSFVNPHQLLVKLSSRRSTIFAINALTGHFYFMNPSPTEMAAQTRINSQLTVVKNKSFISESDMINNVVSNLIQLRLETLSKAIKIKLVTMGWVANDIIQINDYETAKLLNFIIDKRANTYNKIKFYRSRDWPSSWFLINMISGLTSKVYWWVARLKSIRGEWKIQWLQKLQIEGASDLDYSFFQALSKASVNNIVYHLIVEELQSRDIGYFKLESDNLLEKFGVQCPDETEVHTTIALHNTGNLLPISASSSTLFLVASLISNGTANELMLTIFGLLKRRSEDEYKSLHKLNITVSPEKDQFSISSCIDLSSKLGFVDDNPITRSMLTSILGNLAKMKSLLTILEQVTKTDVIVRGNSRDELVFELDPYYKPFLLSISDDSKQSFIFNPDSTENNHVKVVVQFLNRDIEQSNGALLGSFRYLKEFANILDAVDAVERKLATSQVQKLQNELPCLHFDPKLLGLNRIQFVFRINSVNPATPKKVQRDRISFDVCLKRNFLEKSHRLLINFSMKNNFSSQNLKFKKLFETIFRVATELQQESAKKNETFIKLNYDFLLEGKLLKPLIVLITNSFLEFLQMQNGTQ